MVPIHDTDVAAERWSQAEWENYELWEKVELKLKRKKRLWIFGAFSLFIVLSAVPIALERWPKWIARSLSRRLAQEINLLKKEASTHRSAYRLRFTSETGVSFDVEKLPSCQSSQGEIIKTGLLESRFSKDQYTVLRAQLGDELGIPGLTNEICYDPLIGSYSYEKGEGAVGFGIMSQQDRLEKRNDRISILLITGPSAEMSFD